MILPKLHAKRPKGLPFQTVLKEVWKGKALELAVRASAFYDEAFSRALISSVLSRPIFDQSCGEVFDPDWERGSDDA